jgi:hypothetical protein
MRQTFLIPTPFLLAVSLLAFPAYGQECNEIDLTVPDDGVVEPWDASCSLAFDPSELPDTECDVFRIRFPDKQIDPILVELRNTPPIGDYVGTVVFGTGGNGTTWYEKNDGAPVKVLLEELLDRGFRVVQYRWVTPWSESSNYPGTSIKSLSARYAMLIDHIEQAIHTEPSGEVFCAVGNSHGANQIAYALSTWNSAGWNLEEKLDLAVLTDGPNFVRHDLLCGYGTAACELPLGILAVGEASGAQVPCETGCGATVPYFPSLLEAECEFPMASSLIAACEACEPEVLAELGVLHSNADLEYDTRIHILLGEFDHTWSGGHAWDYYDRVQPNTELGQEKAIQFVPFAVHGGIEARCEGQEAILRALLSGTDTPEAERPSTLSVRSWPNGVGESCVNATGTSTPLELELQGEPDATYQIHFDTTRSFCIEPALTSGGWSYLPSNKVLLGSGTLDSNGDDVFEISVDDFVKANPCTIWTCQATIDGTSLTNMVEVRFRP